MPAQAAKASIIEKVTQIVERAGRENSIEPVDVEWSGTGKHRLLRIYIDKPGGVTHGDCEFISQYVGTVLDAEDVIPGAGYRLEVSSPGLERKLAKPRDFERAAGRKIKAVLREPVDGRTVWEGTLSSFDASHTIVLEIPTMEPVRFHLDQVVRANLKFEW
ncbi:MAG: ribosome maturation factor RimP [Acidobacteria bacterium]|nr:ribosome maturation factor RimP [Acidobacteriota bacterium]